jgi:hypothetical protein
MRKILTISILVIFGCYPSQNLFNENNRFRYGNNLFPVKYGALWGYADFYGNTIIHPQFEEASLFQYGIAIVKKNGLYGYIKHTGQWLIKPKYIFAQPFYLRSFKQNKDNLLQKELVALVDADGKGAFYIDKNGKPLKRVPFPKVTGNCEVMLPRIEEYSTKNKDNTYELIYEYWRIKNDTSYTKVVDTTDMRLDTIIELSRHYALLIKDSKFAIYYIDISTRGVDAKTNKRVIVPQDSVHLVTPDFIYENVKFRNVNGKKQPSTIFKRNDKWGILTVGGQQITPFIYEDIGFQENFNNYLVEFEPQKFGYISLISESHYVFANRENFSSYSIVVEHFKRNSASNKRQ